MTATDKAGGDYFGNSVSQSGNILAVGASWSDPDGMYDAGAVYTFDISGYVGSNTIPSDLNSTAPLTFAENQPVGTIVGEFNATDPDANSTLTYYLVSGAGDGNNSLFTLETNGTLRTATTFDYETNASTYSIRVQVRDEYNATAEGNFTVVLTNVNDSPTGIIPSGALSVVENQPAGSFVTDFNATDQDVGASFTFSLVSGSGDSGNAYFTMDANGTLKTAVSFDYETNASTYSIRIQVRDEYNASVENTFTVTLTDDGLHDGAAEVFTVSGGQYGSPYYSFQDSNGQTPDFDTLTLIRGSTYMFINGGVSGSHPFMIGESFGDTSSSHVFGSPLNAGNSGAKLTMVIPSDFSGTLLYYCTVHGSMQKAFLIGDPVVNTTPTNLVTTGLAIAENQPVGTIVGEFNATDPDANATLTYHLVSGAGDGNNSLFTLDTNATLRTATTFDYETNASTYTIRVQVKDEFNATVEGNFTVTLQDWFDSPWGKLTAPDKVESDMFGSSVSQSGNILAVGAYDSDSDGVTDSGAAYLYQLEANGSATYLTKVTAPDKATGDNFGNSVSQSGNILAVGAAGSSTDGFSNNGAAYLYQLEANGTATFLTKVTAPDKSHIDQFGFSVSQSGNILAVGAKYSDSGPLDSGAAYLYRLEANGSATYLSKVIAPDLSMSNKYFGCSVSLSGNILAVGAHNYDPDGVSNAGAAYLYQLEANGSATYLTRVTAPDKAANDEFGVSVSQSGNILAVGAYWSDPDGVSNAGAAYLYQLEANGSATYLSKVTAPDKAAYDEFGVSVSQSGNILAVGAAVSDPDGLSSAGAAYLYQLEANGSVTFLTKVTASDKAANDQFGYSVSQSGNILAVGAYRSDPDGLSNAGAAYTFDISGFTGSNTIPTDLNSTAPLIFVENQPVGTIVGEFNATDPDANATLTYHLVSGAGDTDNSLLSSIPTAPSAPLPLSITKPMLRLIPSAYRSRTSLTPRSKVTSRLRCRIGLTAHGES